MVFTGLEVVGDGTSFIIEDKTTAAPVVDTVAVVDCYLHGTKALYDNSGKATSDVQHLIVKGNLVQNCSDGADWIDLRTGATHELLFVNNTVANSCRTVFRTDADHEMNYATIRNNTFYKVATNSSSKDNNGILHIRSAAGAGLKDFKVQNNFFYSILIDAEPSNAAGFPKVRSKSGLTPNTYQNNYFYNCEDREGKEDYGFWSYETKEATLAGGGAILPADPCKDAENGDYTLTNGVMMNANVGDPRWNPARGGKVSSEITVANVDELLTAISAGKTVITLADGEYDLTAVTEVAEVASGKLTLTSPLTLKGGKGAVLKGGFQMGVGTTELTISGITLSGASSVDNAFYNVEGNVMTKFALVNVDVTAYKNRLLYQDKASSSIESVVIKGAKVTGVSGADFTSGDFIDFRSGGLTALKVTGSTFANGIRTFARIDAGVVCSSILVEKNTFYNLGYAVSKDNNGIMHVRSTSVTGAEQVIVRSNIFAGMKADEESLASAAENVQAAGFPHLVSKASAAIFMPVFQHNYFYDLNTNDPYSFWQYSPKETATAAYGVVLSEDPFKDAANGDFTLVNALASSEKVGDPRWNPATPSRPDGFFPVADVASLLDAIDAGKKEIVLTGTAYDFTASEALTSGKLSLTAGLTLKGQNTSGLKPQVHGIFDASVVEEAVVLQNIKFNGGGTLSDLFTLNADAALSKLVIKDCEITDYTGRFVYCNSATAVCGPVIISGNLIYGGETAKFTGGDFIDLRAGKASGVKVENNTVYNGIRTFVRIDAAFECGAVNVDNNTFYNVLTVVSKDNNGIMHVRSTSAVANARQVTFRKNIVACSMPDEEALAAETNDKVIAAGFPKLVSTAAEKIAHPTCSDNLFYGLNTSGETYNFWNTMTPEDIEAAGTVLEETPFAGDPTTGKFTVKTEYKGIGDTRW